MASANSGTSTSITEPIMCPVFTLVPGNLKTRTIRTTTSRAAWQAYAWLLERRHPADWSRRTELVVADDQTAKVDPLVGVHDELRLARLERQKEQGRS